MRVITLRNVPDDVHRSLVRLAKRNRRSVQQQLLLVLERVKLLDCDSPLDAARAIRRRLAGRDLGDTVAEVRADRSR